MKHDRFCMTKEDPRYACCCHEIALARKESWGQGYKEGIVAGEKMAAHLKEITKMEKRDG